MSIKQQALSFDANNSTSYITPYVEMTEFSHIGIGVRVAGVVNMRVVWSIDSINEFVSEIFYISTVWTQPNHYLLSVKNRFVKIEVTNPGSFTAQVLTVSHYT